MYMPECQLIKGEIHQLATTILIMAFPSGSDSKESTCNVGHLGSIPGLGRSPGRGHGNALQYSCLENPHGQRSLVGFFHGVTKSQTQLKQLSMPEHCRDTQK